MSKKLQQISVPLISVFLGILLGAIVMWIFGYDAIWGYEELFYTAFGSLRGIGEIFRAMGPLVLIGLGFAVASRAGFFNVGLPGQALAGWILSGWFALSHPDMPRPLMILATIVIALIAGGIVGAIEYIHKRLIEERDNGKAVLVVSFELDEILNVSDRIAVIHDGKIQGIVSPETTNKQELGVLMAGGNLGKEKSDV